MTHITCMLTAKNRDLLRNPTLGNRVWATFAFLVITNALDFISLVCRDIDDARLVFKHQRRFGPVATGEFTSKFQYVG